MGEPIQHPQEQRTLETTTGNTAEAAARSGAEGPRRGGSTEGFRFFHFFELAARQPDAGEALRTMSGWIKEGKLKYRESVTHGLDSSVDAFIGMLRGENFGKTMVQVS